MGEISVTYKNSCKVFSNPITYYDVSKEFNVSLAMVAIVDGVLVDLHERVIESCTVDFLGVNHATGYKIYQAGLKFLFMVAFHELFPSCELVIDGSLSKEDISSIKGKMAHFVSSSLPFIPYHLKVSDAYRYFNGRNEDEKSKMIGYSSSDVVLVYRLLNELADFYSFMPYDTSCLRLFELVLLSNNRVVIVCPNLALNGKLPEYVHHENIIQNFMVSKAWLSNINCLYLANLNELVATRKISDFISMNEMQFSMDIIRCCDEVIRQGNVKFVLIAGPSSSGKTTTMKRLATCFQSRGYEPVCLSTDDFFVNRDSSPVDENGNYDFERIDAIDLPFLQGVIERLLNGETVEAPVYNFAEGKREFHGNVMRCSDKSIFLIEGLLCLNDDLLPNISSSLKFKVYLSPFMPLSIDRHNYVSTVDLRLIRRITRDMMSRARKVTYTILDWQNVRNGEEKYIFPYVSQADLIINTSLAYELGVLKVYVLPLLYSVPIDSICYFEARRLIRMLDVFFPISSELVPNDSIIREFIG